MEDTVMERGSLFTAEERYAHVNTERSLISKAQRGDTALLFEFWRTKREMLISRSNARYVAVAAKGE